MRLGAIQAILATIWLCYGVYGDHFSSDYSFVLTVAHSTSFCTPIGQFFGNEKAVVGVSNGSGGFKSIFPVNCRPIDFDQWNNFEGGEESAGVEATTRSVALLSYPSVS